MIRTLFGLERLSRLWRELTGRLDGVALSQNDLKDQLDAVAASTRANVDRLDHLSRQVDVLQRESRVLLSQLTLPPTALWLGRPAAHPGDPASAAFPCSTLCRQESFDQPWFSHWARRLAQPLRYHRKLWEHVFICQALWERGSLRPGACGLGFGVGREPLTALFAAEGCRVLATDMAATEAAALGWSQTAQHAWGLETLRHDAICSPKTFAAKVTFRECDMNAVPDDLRDFDFCWSACALEHLGSIARGVDFIEAALDCLRPGGWAVHTTEYNVSSNDHTVETGGTVLFRQRDLEAMAERLTARGHKVATFDLEPGLAPMDRYVDVAPYRVEPHLKLAVEGYAVTSVGLIVQRGL